MGNNMSYWKQCHDHGGYPRKAQGMGAPQTPLEKKIMSSLENGRTCICAEAQEFGLEERIVNSPAFFQHASFKVTNAGMATGLSDICGGHVLQASFLLVVGRLLLPLLSRARLARTPSAACSSPLFGNQFCPLTCSSNKTTLTM